jgi:tRNA C32,U32 (ribose-2'-O)-methylase TrmJ
MRLPLMNMNDFNRVDAALTEIEAVIVARTVYPKTARMLADLKQMVATEQRSRRHHKEDRDARAALKELAESRKDGRLAALIDNFNKPSTKL